MIGFCWGIFVIGGIVGVFVFDLCIVGFDFVVVGLCLQELVDVFVVCFDIGRVYLLYEVLVFDFEVDIIYVLILYLMYYENVWFVFEYGKYVLVEKVFILNCVEVEDLQFFVVECGLLVMEVMWMWYLLYMVCICEFIVDGVFGEIWVVSVDYIQLLFFDLVYWLNVFEFGGGVLFDLGIYLIFFIWDIFGVLVSVCVVGWFIEMGVDVEVVIVMMYEGGVVLISLFLFCVVGFNVVSIVGIVVYIDIDIVWYSLIMFCFVFLDGMVQEEYVFEVEGCGMQYQVLVVECLVCDGIFEGDIFLIVESVVIMGIFDEIRVQIGVCYLCEEV